MDGSGSSLSQALFTYQADLGQTDFVDVTGNYRIYKCVYLVTT